MPPGVNFTKPLSDCFAAHRALADSAHTLARQIGRDAEDEGDLLRLGGSCVRIAAERALASQNERDAIASWRECDAAERQIRMATYGALRSGAIGNREYDHMFAAAIRAARARRDEIDRLRVRVQLWMLV